MLKIIDKITYKIMEITDGSESDAKKILAGLTILGIAISWFYMGSTIVDNNLEITKKEKQEAKEAGRMAEEATRDFEKKIKK